ncbi:MAG: hypothetical protein HYU64_02125 [Armatimonadetes bacterium]|nr:hypothetical protein [Armatimonadota bacterium]
MTSSIYAICGIESSRLLRTTPQEARSPENPKPAFPERFWIHLLRSRSLALEILDHNVRDVTVGDEQTHRKILQAGQHKFTDLWLRDSSFAGLGILCLEGGSSANSAVVRDCLETILSKQRADGLLPRRVGGGSNRTGVIMAALGIPRKPAEHLNTWDFENAQHTTPIDSNPLIIWLSAEYVKATGDQTFLTKNFPRILKAAQWLATQEKDGLLEQAPFADWKDVVARGGKVLYTNALYYNALTSLSEMAKMMGPKGHAFSDSLLAKAQSVKSQIQRVFWDPARGHFKDTEKLSDFSPDGNLLAVLFGIADPNQTRLVLGKAEKLLEKSRLPLSALDGKYPDSMKPFQLRLGQIPGYHDEYIWPWLGSLYALATTETWKRTGKKDVSLLLRSLETLNAVGRISVRDRDFQEIFEGKDAIPVRRLLYKTEKGFSWSAGLYLKALTETISAAQEASLVSKGAVEKAAKEMALIDGQ